MNNRIFFIANLAVALMLFLTTIFLTPYGTAVNISMSYLFSVVAVWIVQRIMPKSKLKENSWQSGHLMTFLGIILSFLVSFAVLYFTGAPLKSLIGRIIILSVALINGIYLFMHVYYYKRSI